jgi:hypothetical protein
MTSLSPRTGAPIAGFTADVDAAGTELEATNTTVYLGCPLSAVNVPAKSALAAPSATTTALVGRTSADAGSTFGHGLIGGIGPNGGVTVQELKLSMAARSLVCTPGRQVNWRDRYGVALVNTTTEKLLPCGPGCGRTTRLRRAAASASIAVTSQPRPLHSPSSVPLEATATGQRHDRPLRA